MDTAKLASLLDEIDKIDTQKDEEQDVIGRVYEYFLGKFALAEGKGKGEFYTPKCIVNLIAELIEPYKGKIYDPCCGSGGMFVQSVRFIQSHQGNARDVSIYGQEYTNTTFKLAKMNLAIRGISCNLGEQAANTFTNDQHKDLKADFIMAIILPILIHSSIVFQTNVECLCSLNYTGSGFGHSVKCREALYVALTEWVEPDKILIVNTAFVLRNFGRRSSYAS